MWIKKINEFFENISEYDNNSLLLHVSVNLIDMLKERILFKLDKDCNIYITILPYKEQKEEEEVDEDGFLYWLQFKFHRELIDIIISLKQKYSNIQNMNKQLINDAKLSGDETTKTEISQNIEKNSKEMEALAMIVNKVDGYRRNTFSYLRDKDSVIKIIEHIKIYKEQCE